MGERDVEMLQPAACELQGGRQVLGTFQVAGFVCLFALSCSHACFSTPGALQWRVPFWMTQSVAQSEAGGA